MRNKIKDFENELDFTICQSCGNIRIDCECEPQCINFYGYDNYSDNENKQ